MSHLHRIGGIKMPSYKSSRNAEDIKRELSSILRELKDPRIQNNFISIVRVEVSNDLSFCKVYISAMEGIEKAKEAIQGLKSATGYIKREIGQRLHLRQIPNLSFTATDAIEYSANISKILHSLKDE